MAKQKLMGAEATRVHWSARLEAATVEGEHTIVTKHGQPEVAVVPMKWYREMRALSGDPTDL